MRRRRFLLLACLALGPAAFASDPVDYSVRFVPSGDPTLDSLLAQTSSLVSLRRKLPPAPFALIGRAQADTAQFAIVLHSLGYDAGTVTITIDGEPLKDPALLDSLTQLPRHRKALVVITAHPGPIFHIGQVTTPGLPPGFQPPALPSPGQPALAGPILAGSDTLQTALRNAGYAFATAAPPLAIAHLDIGRLDITYAATPGPREHIGPIAFAGLKRADPDFLRRHIALKPGQLYADTALNSARDALLSLGIFAAVTPEPEQKTAAPGEVPILFRVEEQKRHAVSLSGAYDTDQGFTLGLSWEDRDVFRHAETLTFTAAANGLGGTGTTSPGYDLKGVFAKPDYERPGQTLNMSLEGVKQSLTAYNRTALLAAANLSRPLTAHIALTYGPQFEEEGIQQEGTSRNYVLLQFPVTLAYDTADSTLEPTQGLNASVTVTPSEAVIGDHTPFIILAGSAATYLPVEAQARGLLALRAQFGSILGARQFGVPPDERFYAGGSGTVRGYTYQTIGPLFADDNPEGGLGFDAFSLEFRQHITKTIGIVPFLDAGQVSAGSAPFTGRMRFGAGLGARYYTSVGPIRVDLAFPFTRVANSGGFALYVGLGEAF